jgi:hypothetical protein
MTYPDGTNARLIEVAAAEIGTIEEGDNLTKYGKFTKASKFIQSSALPSARINSKKSTAGQTFRNWVIWLSWIFHMTALIAFHTLELLLV